MGYVLAAGKILTMTLQYYWMVRLKVCVTSIIKIKNIITKIKIKKLGKTVDERLLIDIAINTIKEPVIKSKENYILYSVVCKLLIIWFVGYYIKEP